MRDSGAFFDNVKPRRSRPTRRVARDDVVDELSFALAGSWRRKREPFRVNDDNQLLAAARRWHVQLQSFVGDNMEIGGERLLTRS